MTLATTYEPTLSRVKVDMTALPLYADFAKVERSIDGITWKTVRGGDSVPLTAGVGHIYDYEFDANVLNTYRIRAVDNAALTVVAAGAPATAVNASVTPALYAGPQIGDVVVAMGSIRNSGTGTVNTPAGGWTVIGGAGTNFLIVGKQLKTALDVSGLAAPTFTFAGGAANQDTLGVVFGVRNARLPPTSVATQLNASAQNVDTPAYTFSAGGLACRTGWKQDDMSSITFTSPTIAVVSSTAGDDASMFAAGVVVPNAGTGGATAVTVNGGAAAISRAINFGIPKAEFIFEETSTITPPLDQVWIKNVTRPNLNIAVTIVGPIAEETQRSRDGLFDVVGRTYPIAVTELRGSRETVYTVRTETLAEAEDFRLRMMTGQPVFLHTPDIAGDCEIPTMYVRIGDITKRKPEFSRSRRRYFDLPVTEIAAPVSTVVGTTITYADVLAQFATYADILPAEPTYSDLLDRIGTPGQVIVP